MSSDKVPARSTRFVLAIFAALLVTMFLFVAGWQSKCEKWDAELTSIAAQIRPGESKSQLKTRVNNYLKKVPATFIISDDQFTWYVMNPLELGAHDRILTLDFDARGYLAHRLLRTRDTARTLPPGAPPDF